MKKSTLVLLLGLLVFISSCERYRCIEGNGIYASEDRVSPSFTGIELDFECDVYVEIDTFTAITVEGDQNLLSKIYTTVRREKLEINTHDNRCLKSENPIIIYVKTPELDNVEINGTGAVFCDDDMIASYVDLSINGSGLIDCKYINTTDLYMYINGTGEIVVDADAYKINGYIDGSGKIEVLNGFSDKSFYTIEGSGLIDAYGHTTDICYVAIEGSGLVRVYVNDLLDIEIDGTGDVEYGGRPQLR